MKRNNYVIYKGRNSPVEIQINYNNAPMDFAALGVTKVGVMLGGVEYDSTGPEVDISTNGKIVAKLGGISNPPSGVQFVRVIIYTSDKPKGQVIFSEKTDDQITIEFA